MTPTRDSIFTGLLTLLSGLSLFTPSSYVSRRFKLWSDLSPAQFPALCVLEPEEEVTWPADPLYRDILSAEAIFYLEGSADQTVNNYTALDNLLDAVDAVLKPTGGDAIKGRQTLAAVNGGVELVRNTRIEGRIVKVAGDIDNISLLLVPIKMLVGQKIA